MTRVVHPAAWAAMLVLGAGVASHSIHAAPHAAQSAAPGARSAANGPSAPSTPVRAARSPAVDTLADDLRKILAKKTRNGRWGIQIVSLSRGDTLFEVNQDDPFTPASTMKLFTSAIAFQQFGPDHHFSTDVLREGSIDADGTLRGNLILRGDGDPALSNRFLQGTADAPMDLLAGFLREAGIRRVTGDLIADASAFEERRVPEGWLARNLGSSYAARVSALSLNENVMRIVARPTDIGRPLVFTEPATASLTLVDAVRQVAGRTGASIVVRRLSDTSFEARGWIGARSVPRAYEIVVEDPARFAAGALRSAMAAAGIPIDGKIRVGTTPATAVVVRTLPSPPLERLVSVMNRESINHYAELLFRNSARGPERNGLGSADAGHAILNSFLTLQVGVKPGSVTAADGSGLSVLDRITPRALVQLLGYAHRAPWASAFHASLPVAGESELLRGRMRNTPAQGNLHAKTGTTAAVIGLGGYVTSLSGEVLAFSFLYNGTDRTNARTTIDAMGARLASFARE